MTRVHDVIGIGIGPFNLGLACLGEPLGLDAVFLDSADEFRWHHGMMIEGATIQVPFLADLVTMADPTSRFSFLSFLKQTGRLYPFYIREDFFPLRVEYDAYCRWAAAQLASLRWGRTVERVEHDPQSDDYVVHARSSATGEVETYRARHLVLGTGTAPRVPASLQGVDGPIIHTAEYLHRRDELIDKPAITIVGSGQSAAEIYRDLLETIDQHEYQLDWITRSPRFFPMEYTKLTLEMTSPEYTDHFHGLPMELRDRLGREQRGLYKGISGELVDDIYDTLYRKSAARPVPTTLLTDTELLGAEWHPDEERYTLRLRHAQLGEEHPRTTSALILATGYAARTPTFLDPVADRIQWDGTGRFAVARDYSIDGGRVFVQNGEEHTHGLTAPDLGFGAWRNSSILASILGGEPYPIERRIAFQEFGIPSGRPSHADAAAVAR
ncbi:MAG TPA: SidA/IucD/PvdA family monooxygenase [Agromyces sp.]